MPEPVYLEQSTSPKALTKPATKVRVITTAIHHEQGSVNPEAYAVSTLRYYDEDGNPLGTVIVGFTAEELSTWGDDDNVLLTLALAKLK